MIPLSEARERTQDLLRSSGAHTAYIDAMVVLAEQIYHSFADSLEVEELKRTRELDPDDIARIGYNQAIRKNQQLKKELLS